MKTTGDHSGAGMCRMNLWSCMRLQEGFLLVVQGAFWEYVWIRKLSPAPFSTQGSRKAHRKAYREKTAEHPGLFRPL